jgi:endonuclease/exonuclease/phosphatase family metal-dependent hydrolase
MGWILRRILQVIYLTTLVPTVGAILSQWISPGIAWPIAFFGLFFPMILLIQIVFFLLFLLMRSKAVVLPVLVILAGWTAVENTFQVSFSGGKANRTENHVKVMTYNVRLFDFFEWSGQKNMAAGIFSYIRDQKPDILCLQEFLVQDPGKIPMSRIEKELDFLPYHHIEYNYTMQARKHGLAIFSRFPIVSAGHEHFADSRNMFIYADLKIANDTIRVYNNHLESIHFERDEFELIDNKEDKSKLTREKISEIVKRMDHAYKKRALQAEIVREHRDQSPHPVIVCGDFNDTPVSYTTSKIRKGLFDSFRSGGSGLGITFPNMMAPLRIDYILHSKEMASSGYGIGKVKYSDHRPVSTLIQID